LKEKIRTDWLIVTKYAGISIVSRQSAEQ